MNAVHFIALRHIGERQIDIRTIGEPMRQRVIDLGMMEPPLVRVDADQVFITEAGRSVLAADSNSLSVAHAESRGWNAAIDAAARVIVDCYAEPGMTGTKLVAAVKSLDRSMQAIDD